MCIKFNFTSFLRDFKKTVFFLSLILVFLVVILLQSNYTDLIFSKQENNASTKAYLKSNQESFSSQQFHITSVINYENRSEKDNFFTRLNLNSSFQVLILPPKTLYILYGSTGNQLTWNVDSDNPADVLIFRNGNLLLSQTWFSGAPLTISIDGLAVGIYNYTIQFNDYLAGAFTDTVIVTVSSNGNNSNIVSSNAYNPNANNPYVNNPNTNNSNGTFQYGSILLAVLIFIIVIYKKYNKNISTRISNWNNTLHSNNQKSENDLTNNRTHQPINVLNHQTSYPDSFNKRKGSFCSKCGNLAYPEDVFCQECGSRL